MTPEQKLESLINYKILKAKKEKENKANDLVNLLSLIIKDVVVSA